MKFNRKLLLIIFTILFLISLVWDLSLYLLPSHTTSWNYLYAALYGTMDLLGGMMAIVYGIQYGLRSNLGKMLLSFGLLLIFYAIGIFIFIYYCTVLRVALPYPSWADAAFVIDCIFSIAGMFYFVSIYRALVSKRLVILCSGTAFIAFVVVFGFIVKPDISEGVPFVVKFLNLYYPLTDVISITLAVMALFIGGGKFYTYFYLFAFRFVGTAIADFVYTYRATTGIYWVGDVADLMFAIAGYVLIIALIEIIYSMKQSSANPSSIPPQQTTT